MTSIKFFFTIVALALANPSLGDDFEPGLIDSFTANLPVELWSEPRAEKAAQSIETTNASDLQTINKMRINILITQSRPALSDEKSGKLMAARLNYLIRIGALDPAEALANEADWENDDIRAEVEKIAVLTTRPTRYCDGLFAGDYHEIQPGFKIYCLAINNRWPEAQTLFEISDLPKARHDALARFLSIDGSENQDWFQPWSNLPDPLDFVLDEAIGRPHGDVDFPPAYAYFLRENGTTPRYDLEMSEQLAQLGALPSGLLFVAYRGNVSAESGGAWGRAESVQKLDAIDPTAPPDNLDQLIETAINRFREANLLTAFSQDMGKKFKLIDLETQSKSTRQNIIQLGLLGGWSDPSWGKYINPNEDALELAYQLRHGGYSEDLTDIKTGSIYARVVKNAFYGNRVNNPNQIDGYSLWQALEQLDKIEDAGDQKSIEALQELIISNQNAQALEISIALLLSRPS